MIFIHKHFISSPVYAQELVGKCRVIERVVGIMKAHIKDVEVCYSGCDLLVDLIGKHSKTRPDTRAVNMVS